MDESIELWQPSPYPIWKTIFIQIPQNILSLNDLLSSSSSSSIHLTLKRHKKFDAFQATTPHAPV